jgi:aminomethyltransferase
MDSKGETLMYSTDEQQLRKTALYNMHISAKAKMVNFAGYDMPLHYSTGIMREHNHTRDAASLFDVSHMGQIILSGSGIGIALEKLIPIDLQSMPIYQQHYGVMTNTEGGIVDDLIVTRWAEDTYFLVVNAARKEEDLNHLRNHLSGFTVEYMSDHALIALQGPKAVKVMEELSPTASNLIFMNSCHISIGGVDCFVSRSGYTGEDGFEISVDQPHARALCEQLLANGIVKWAGLDARDSLRLEAGLCLYGNELNETISPVQAGLSWTISKTRRPGGINEGGFLGADAIFAEMARTPKRSRVGFVIEHRAPVRRGAKIIDNLGDVVGVVTSGGFSPTLGLPIAMGYVQREYSVPGSGLNAIIRGKPRGVVVTEMPLVPTHYYRSAEQLTTEP